MRTCRNRRCGRLFSRRARFCPACGTRQRRRLTSAFLFILVAGAIVMTLAAMQPPHHRRHSAGVVPINQYPSANDPWPALIVSVSAMDFDQAKADTVVEFVRTNHRHLHHSRRLDSARLEQIIREFEFDATRQRAITALQPFLAR